jgi:endonuclease III
MAKKLIVKRIIQYGKKLSERSYTDNTDKAADRFIRSNHNAWLFAVIFDQGISYQRAWTAPYTLKRRLGHFNIARIAKTPLVQIRKAVKGSAPGEALHRYVNKVPLWLKKAATKLVKEDRGDASNIWKDCRSAGEVIERFDEFPGISQKKAHMATRILHDKKVRFSRLNEINVAVDVHVRRVWKRAGLSKDLSVAGIMGAATELKPDYPGDLDYPIWQIGLEWCHPRGADCHGKHQEDGIPCPLLRVCSKNGVRSRGYK